MRIAVVCAVLVSLIGLNALAAQQAAKVHVRPHLGGAGLVVIVTDSASGAPMSRAAVRVRKNDSRGPEGWSDPNHVPWADTATVADSTGTARFMSLIPGDYRVWASGDCAVQGDSAATVHQWSRDTLRLRLHVKLPCVVNY